LEGLVQKRLEKVLPIVSVVSPSFNQAQFLDSTIRSVVTQNGDFYLDYIIRDGASTDGSVDIIRRWDSALKEDVETTEWSGLSWRIPASKKCVIQCGGVSFRWHSGRDTGQSQAINEGFGLAVGDLGGWLNSDDSFTPFSIQSALKAFSVSRRVVFGMAQAVDQYGNLKWTQSFWKRAFDFYDSYYRNYTPPQPSVFFPVKLFRLVGGLDERLHYMLDVDLWQRMILANGSFAYVPQILSKQTYHPDSKSMSGGGLFLARGFTEEKEQVWLRRKHEIGFRAYLWGVKRKVELAVRSSIDAIRVIRRRFLGIKRPD
jgi:glycosyltransferase involved in cell wall biosynthesis